MKRIILINVIIILISSCSSNKSVTKKQQRFVRLDSIAVQKQMVDYELNIPDSWCSYLGIHAELTHSPNTILNLKESYYKNQLYVIGPINDNFKSKDIEDALKSHVVELNPVSEYNPVYTSDTHKIYGKYYIIKQRMLWKGEKLLSLRALFNYNNKDYLICYSVLEAHYNNYQNEVIQIIASFKIKE